MALDKARLFQSAQSLIGVVVKGNSVVLVEKEPELFLVRALSKDQTVKLSQPQNPPSPQG